MSTLKNYVWENVRSPFYLNRLTKISEILKHDKKMFFTVLFGIVGILFILLSFGAKSDSKQDCVGLEEYKSKLEGELEALCESIDGAGKCRVTVSFSEGQRVEYRGSAVVGSEPPRVLGITVVCDGGDDPHVRSSVSECMTALFDIGSNRVCVLKLK